MVRVRVLGQEQSLAEVRPPFVRDSLAVEQIPVDYHTLRQPNSALPTEVELWAHCWVQLPQRPVEPDPLAAAALSGTGAMAGAPSNAFCGRSRLSNQTRKDLTFGGDACNGQRRVLSNGDGLLAPAFDISTPPNHRSRT
jgi:hypothetical protein